MKINELIKGSVMATKSEKLNNVLLIIVLYFLASISLVFAFSNLIGIVTDEMVSIYKIMPKVIIYTLPMFYVIFLFRNAFYKKFSKPGAIVFISIMSVIIIAALVFFFMEASYHFSNLTYNYYQSFTPLDTLLISAILLGANVVVLIKIIKGHFAKHTTLGYSYGPFAVTGVLRMVTISILGFFLGWFLIQGLFALTYTEYLTYETLKFLLMIGWMLLPCVVYFLYCNLDFKRKSSFVLFVVFAAISVIYCVIFDFLLVLMDDFLVVVGQPIFVLTFSSSFPIGQSLLKLINVFFVFEIIYTSIRFAKYQKTNK